MSGRDGTDGASLQAFQPSASAGGIVAIGVVVVVVAGVVGLVLAGVGPLGADGPGSAIDVLPGGPAENETSPTPSATGTDATGSPTTSGNGTPAPLPAGERLEGARSLADADVVVEGAGSDELGYAAAVGDVNGDGTPDVVLGAPHANATATRSGAVYVFFGPVAPGDLTVADADVTLTGGSNGDWAGNSVAVGDLDGDGAGDLVVGAPREDEAASNAGAVYVVRGGPELNGTIPLESADWKITGDVPGSLAGYSVDAGNVTGDATVDVVVGAPRGEDSPGHAYVVDGRRVGSTGSLAEGAATLVGEAAGDEAGWRVAVARNATGTGDPAVVVGAPRNDAAGENAGAAYAVAAPFEGRTPLGDAALVLRGPEEGALAGWSVAAPGDVDGDGRTDVLVGAPFAGSGGTAYVARGGTGERALGDATALRGAAPGDQAGWAVAGTADLTCDGSPDVLVGAPGNDAAGQQAGAVYLASGGESTDLADAPATLEGASAGDEAGHVDAIGTIRGADATGLVVGAPFGEPPHTAHVVYAACPAE